jgi:hypothetical protein
MEDTMTATLVAKDQAEVRVGRGGCEVEVEV